MSLKVDIVKRLGGFTLDASFECGGVMGLLGESGAGKSVTLKCIAGIMKPDEGHIELFGRVLFDSASGVDLSPQARRVGLLLQGGGLFPNMTVEKNILAGRRDMALPEARERARALMERFKLLPNARQYPNALSGGQAQRCALARILMSAPDALLMDEPLTSLDEAMRRQLEQALRETFDSFGGPVVYVSHDRGEAYRLCPSICVASGGRAHGSYARRELYDYPRDRAAAMLTGCRNISGAHPVDSHTLFAEDWGLTLVCASNADGATDVGVRDEYVEVLMGTADKENTFELTVLDVTEDTDRSTVTFMTPGGAPLYARAERDTLLTPGDRISVHIPADRVTPLGAQNSEGRA